MPPPTATQPDAVVAALPPPRVGNGIDRAIAYAGKSLSDNTKRAYGNRLARMRLLPAEDAATRPLERFLPELPRAPRHRRHRPRRTRQHPDRRA